MSINRRRNVTAEQKQRIRELYDKTGNGHEVARVMGLGHTTVYNYLGLGGKKTRWGDDEDQVVVEGYAEKLSCDELSQKTGRSVLAIRLHMCRHRKLVRSDPKKRLVLAGVSRLAKTGGSIAQILMAMRKADILQEVEP